MAALQNEEAIVWNLATHIEKSETVDLSKEGERQTPDGALTALSKRSDRIVAQQKVTLRNQEEKSDSRMKAWRSLPVIQQNVILFGGIDEDDQVPKEPTEEMYSILGCQNRAQVDQYLKQSMTVFNVSFEPGFCTALNKDMLVCPDDTATPRNVAAFLTPPMKDIDEDE